MIISFKKGGHKNRWGNPFYDRTGKLIFTLSVGDS